MNCCCCTGHELLLLHWAWIAVLGHGWQINKYNFMFSFIVIIFEVLAVLFIGIFARTTSFQTDFIGRTNFFSSAMILMLAFALMYSPFRKLSIFAMVTMLLSLAIAAQTNILFGTFWDSCFNGFYSSFTVTVTLLIRSTFASLAVLITCLDFAGLFDYWQIYLVIAPIMTVGYSLSSSILTYGLKVYDGGGGLIIFLYSGVFSIMIWVVCIRGKVDIVKFKIKESYINHTLALVGVAIAFISWPSFNAGGAMLSMVNTPLATTDYYLQSSAIVNTFLGLATAILVCIVLASKDSNKEKLKVRLYVDCFINGGIVIASYQDISQDPVAGMLMALLAIFLTIMIQKYFISPSKSQADVNFKFLLVHYSKIFYRVIYSFLGILVCSIVVATRSIKTPTLISSGQYGHRAALQILAFIIVFVIGIVFGGVTAVLINCFISYKQKEVTEKEEEETVVKKIDAVDDHFFEGLFQEMHPIYKDIFEKEPQNQEIDIVKYTTQVIKDSLLRSADNPLHVSVIKEYKPKPIEQDTNNGRLIISKNFSRRQIESGINPNVSKMKVVKGKEQEQYPYDYESQKQEETPINPGMSMIIQRSIFKIVHDENLPNNNKQVSRRLEYEEMDSHIQEEIPHSQEIKR